MNMKEVCSDKIKRARCGRLPCLAQAGRHLFRKTRWKSSSRLDGPRAKALHRPLGENQMIIDSLQTQLRGKYMNKRITILMEWLAAIGCAKRPDAIALVDIPIFLTKTYAIAAVR